MDRGLEAPKVKDILTKDVVVFSPNYSPLEAVMGFNKHRISSAPIVNENQEVVGFLSENDLIKCIGSCLFFDEKRNPNIETIMTKEVSFADPEWDIFVLENFFVENHIRTAPVVDKDGHLLGIISRRDALHALEKIMKDRDEYKKEIKTPVEMNMSERIKVILNAVD